MTDTNTLTSVTISNGQFYSNDPVLDIARDFLQGETRDYYFFQYDDDDYYLLIPTNDYQYSDTGYFTADLCECYKITRIITVSQRQVELPFSGSESGTMTGIENGGVYRGTLSGRISDIVYDTQVSYKSGYYEVSNVYIQNPSYYTVYGSFDHLPHLIQGVENYAFLGVLLFIGVVGFNLADRLFKRLY